MKKNSPKYFVSLLVFLFQAAVIAQDKQDQFIDEMILITISPLALADIYDGPSYRFGGEVKAGKKLAFALEAGGYLNYLNSTKINPKGFIVKPEIKYYLGRNAKGDRHRLNTDSRIRNMASGTSFWLMKVRQKKNTRCSGKYIRSHLNTAFPDLSESGLTCNGMAESGCGCCIRAGN